MIHAVTVFCSSSIAIPRVHLDAGHELGAAIARQNWKLVYGGNNVGMMGVLADAARANGGKVIGITPQLFVDKGVVDSLCDELIVTAGMRERKQMLESRGDAFVALPGGLGTFEEMFEIVVGRQLQSHTKPIVVLNINGYWDPMLEQIERGIEQKFIKPVARDYWCVAPTVSRAIDYIRTYVPRPFEPKWFEKNTPGGND